MIAGACEGCGHRILVRDEAAARGTRCPKCGGALGTPAPVPVAEERPERAGRPAPGRPRAAPAPDERPEPRPHGPRFLAAAAWGLAAPFVFFFVLFVEIGLESLLGRSAHSRVAVDLFPRDAFFKLFFVALLAVLAAVLGGVAGHAGARLPGALLGAGAGYLFGGAGGGILVELVTGGRAPRGPN
ncbi:MAG: hypothetical protein J0I06_15960 [Planctomycetes bacterium]|nr:hypothetical protein [Planctomycetota bacterium]